MGIVLDSDPVDSLHPAYQDIAETLRQLQGEPWGDGRSGPVLAMLGRRLDPVVGRLETNSGHALQRDHTEACGTGHALRGVVADFTADDHRSASRIAGED